MLKVSKMDTELKFIVTGEKVKRKKKDILKNCKLYVVLITTMFVSFKINHKHKNHQQKRVLGIILREDTQLGENFMWIKAIDW